MVKQTVLDLINLGLKVPHFRNPVKACFFFGVPHRGLKKGDDFATILNTMRSVLEKGAQSDASVVGTLKSRNRAMVNLSHEFDRTRRPYNVTCVSFCESQLIGNTIVVPKDSALLDADSGDSYVLEAAHRQMVKLLNHSDDLNAVLNLIRRTFTRIMVSGPALTSSSIRPHLAPHRDSNLLEPSKPVIKSHTVNKERVYSRLGLYDTVVIVDDSSSMYGPWWATASRVLGRIAAIAGNYCSDGIDIRFFNQCAEDRLSIKTAEGAKQLMESFEPEGGSPTADALESELSDYVYRYKKSRVETKGLNLIVLTDGEPDDDQDVEDVISRFAQELDRLDSPRHQVGIQFVQIGCDERAANALTALDEELQKKYSLDRDVSSPFFYSAGRAADKD